MSSAWIRLGATLVAVLQLALLGLAATGAQPATLVLGELALVSTVAVALLIGRYLALRSAYRHERERGRRLRERQLVADSVHDLVGHEIALIAMQAGLLQLKTEGEAAELAAQLRLRADRAVRCLHDSLALLATNAPARSGLVGERGSKGPTTGDIGRLVGQHRRAGADVTLHGAPPEPSPVTRLAIEAVVREGLTNAARHAPGRPVDVSVTEHDQQIEVEVVTHEAPTTAPRPDGGHGLDSLRRRVEAIGGQLLVDHDTRRHILAASLPVDPGEEPESAEVLAGPRRPLRRLMREVAVPVVAVMAAALAFYSWATHDASVEPDVQAHLQVGTPRAVAEEILPSRQAPVRLIRAPRHPRGSECRSYTNGNFPLGIATLEVCFDDRAVVRITDLAARPLW